MAIMTKWAAGLFLSSALAMTGTAQAAPDCKASWGNAACPLPKTAKPLPAAKPGPAAAPKSAASPEPKPRPEPKVVRRTTPPSPAPKTAAKKPEPQQPARHAAKRRTYAEISRGHGREEWKAFDDWRARSGYSVHPPSGPAYAYAPDVIAGGGGCGDACQYREWFERYSRWYDRYGRDYGASQDGPAMARPANPPEGPALADGRSLYRQSGMRPDQIERDRMDPWHGYNSSDGLENGY